MKINDIINILSEVNITCSEEQASLLFRYYEILIEKNKVMNLTAITEFEDVVKKHFADSLMLGRYVNLDHVTSIIDIGSGAGFPGIPVHIIYPHIHILLVDSLQKRVGFLNEVIKELGLTNIETVHGRSEELARDKAYREQFDLCTARAVAPMSTLSEYCLPFVKKDGYFAAMKSGNIIEECEEASYAVKVLGGTDTTLIPYSLYDMDRSIVLIRKTKTTPALYPRKAGTPKKNPLTKR